MDWFPWGEEAFAEARRRDVPVLLSIGYAACHWCHVMERESFESEEIAEVLGTSRTAVKTLLLRARESFRLHYAKMHPALAAQARGPRVLPRAMGRTSPVAEARAQAAQAQAVLA